MKLKPCEYCGAPPMFKKGDRVALNSNWANDGINPQRGDKATVVGQSRALGCVRVLFDGRKTLTSFHQSFLSKI
jgi:hypothetical protein